MRLYSSDCEGGRSSRLLPVCLLASTPADVGRLVCPLGSANYRRLSAHFAEGQVLFREGEPSASATCRPGAYRRPKEKPTPPRGMVSGGSLISAFGIKRAIRGFDTLEALGGFRDRPSNPEIIGLAFDY